MWPNMRCFGFKKNRVFRPVVMVWIPVTMAGPRVYFLFLAVDKISNLDVWTAFFDSAESVPLNGREGKKHQWGIPLKWLVYKVYNGKSRNILLQWMI